MTSIYFLNLTEAGAEDIDILPNGLAFFQVVKYLPSLSQWKKYKELMTYQSSHLFFEVPAKIIF